MMNWSVNETSIMETTTIFMEPVAVNTTIGNDYKNMTTTKAQNVSLDHVPFWNRYIDNYCPSIVESSDNYAMSYNIAFVCVMIFGFVYTFFGYRCFKAVMFITGGAFVSVVLIHILNSMDTMFPETVIWGVSFCVGLLIGLASMLLQLVGLFLTGFTAGIILSIVSFATADYAYGYRVNEIVNSNVMIGFGICVGFLTQYFKKSFTIIGTSLLGSAMVVASVDYFVERLVLVNWLLEKTTQRRYVNPCHYTFCLAIFWPCFMLFGLVFQCVATRRQNYHDSPVGSSRRSKKANRIPQNERPIDRRAEIRQQKYRYLYQVRTAHGDVISQSYVQALQNKVIPGMMTNIGESSTLQSDATHLTTLPVDQMTQTPSTACNTVDSDIRFDSQYPHHESRESIESQLNRHYIR